MDEAYGKWTNRETWAAAQWISNVDELRIPVKKIIEEPFDLLGSTEEKLWWFLGGFCKDALKRGDKEALAICLDIGSLWRINWKKIIEEFSE